MLATLLKAIFQYKIITKHVGFLGKIRGQNSNDVTSFFVQQEKERHADGDGATAVNYSKKCFHCVFHYLDLIPI